MAWFGKESWLGLDSKSATHLEDRKEVDSHKSSSEIHDESTRLLTSDVLSSIQNDPLKDCTTQMPSINKAPNTSLKSKTRTLRQWCVMSVCCVSMVYIVSGLIVFAVGLFWRTGTFVALLGPLTCLFVVLTASEYYHLKRSKRCRR